MVVAHASLALVADTAVRHKKLVGRLIGARRAVPVCWSTAAQAVLTYAARVRGVKAPSGCAQVPDATIADVVLRVFVRISIGARHATTFRIGVACAAKLTYVATR